MSGLNEIFDIDGIVLLTNGMDITEDESGMLTDGLIDRLVRLVHARWCHVRVGKYLPTIIDSRKDDKS